MGIDPDGYVLLVEDDPDTCAVFRFILGAEGYRVVHAHGGFEALYKLRTEPGRPRLVILDLSMPGIDGYEFRRMKSKAPQFADVPVVVVSAITPEADLASADDVKALFSKPVNVPRFLQEVAAWAGTARP
jgi:CheY-like chemotaxis protein